MTFDQRILVVDDDDAIRALLQTVLRRRGLRVDGARNGVEALELLGANPYAMVVLDLMMPRMSGYELLDQLAHQPTVTRPRVLVLTAGLDSRRIPPSVAADLVIGTVHKPFDIEMLVDIVTGYLSAESQQHPPETTDRTSPH